MISKEVMVEGFNCLVSSEYPIFISGASGTGKTTLALYLVGNILTSSEPFEDSCIWVQASEIFPKKRLESLFNSDQSKLKFLCENIYITPKTGTCKSYSEQFNTLSNIINSSVFPSALKFIVIDNISHHLRYEDMMNQEYQSRIKLKNSFYGSCLMPLILLCKRNHITLILIHEVSFNPNSGQNRPYFARLYERLDRIDLVLEKSIFKDQNSLKVGLNVQEKYQEKLFKYILKDEGFIWL